MFKTGTVWKLVGTEIDMHGNIHYCSYSELPPEVRLNYKLDEWTRPIIPNSKIFCFHTLSDLMYYVRYGYIGSILECDYEGVPRLMSLRHSIHSEPEDYQRFWNGPGSPSSFDVYPTHAGTVGVDAVKPIREVNPL